MRISTTNGRFTDLSLLPHLNGSAANGQLPGPSPGAQRKINDLVVSAARFVSRAGTQAAQLQSTIAGLPTTLNRTIPVSGNSDALRIRSFSGNNAQQTSVQIHQIAKTQQNEGETMDSSGIDMPSGTHKFEIEIDGETTQITFTTSEGLINRAFQQLMADAINRADLGLNATVTTSNNATQSTLNIETTATGAGEEGEPRFIIRDIGDGNVVEATGAANIAREGQDAIFTVNGAPVQTSASNDVDLGGGLNVTLVKASAEAVSITPGRDVVGIQNGVRQLVSRFNALLETARANPADRNTRALTRELESILRRNRAALENIGLDVSTNGLLSINEDRLEAAAQSGTAANFLNSSRSNGFTGALGRISESVSRNPLRHINPSALRMPGFDAALNAMSNNNSDGNARQASPFDAYMPDDSLEFLLSILG